MNEIVGHRYDLTATYITFRKHLSIDWRISNQWRTAYIFKVEGRLCKVEEKNWYYFSVCMCACGSVKLV